MIIRRPVAACRVKRAHRIADRVSRQCKHAFVNDDNGDFAVRDRFAAIVFDSDVDLCLAAGSERFVDGIGRDSQFARCGRDRQIDVAARKRRTLGKLRIDLALVVCSRLPPRRDRPVP